MKLKIITQERVVFDDEVDEIYTKTTDGEIGILKNHVPIMTSLEIGVTRAKKDGVTKYFTTMGGILQFKDEECTILTSIAEQGEEIDELRAKEALERAQQKLREAKTRIDSKRADAAIARAKARLKAKLSGDE